MSKHSEIILEDKAIYGLNKVHKNVLRSNPTEFHNTRVSENEKSPSSNMTYLFCGLFVY
jgi:hypothetical protein